MLNCSTLTGILDRLENKGFVERWRSSPDRRIIMIYLTEAGKKVVENAPPPIQKKLFSGLNRLPTEEIGQIVKALATLIRFLDIDNEESERIQSEKKNASTV
jgi:DNA-binding MarR family transcriptional regulator